MQTVTAYYRCDENSPRIETTIRYQVLSEDETEIVFSNGESRIFRNCDVKGMRERAYREELETAIEDYAPSQIAGTVHRIGARDIIRFIEELSQKPEFERYFEAEFQRLVELLSRPPEEVVPAPVVVPPLEIVPPTVTKIEAPKIAHRLESKRTRVVKGSKFPYVEVARLWEEGVPLREIARRVGYLDPKQDCTHTIRTYLTKMHQGYINANGEKVCLPYRTRGKERKVAASV